jgi:aryl sulfotransferase
MSGTAWLASYPKSGNTWVRALIHALHNGGIDRMADLGQGHLGDGMQAVPGVPMSDLSDTEALQVLRLGWRLAETRTPHIVPRKTHEAWIPAPDGHSTRWLPEDVRAIYIVRDPRAVAVSFAHHLGWSHTQTVEAMSREDMTFRASHFAHGGFRSLSWSGHVRSWTRQQDIPVMVVRYEDLAAEPQAELGRIAAFMDITASAEQISQAVQDCDFTTFVAREAMEGFAEAPSVHRAFFRKGTVDSWVDELDAALAARIVAEHSEVMREFNYLD